MHPLHQILARAASREKVKPGEFIEPHKTPGSCLEIWR